MGIFSGKTKDKNLKIVMGHKSGLPNFRDGDTVLMTYEEENQNIVFRGVMNKANNVNLSVSKITSITIVDEEIIKEAHGVRRAAAGALLFGPTGAIVGALTAKDKKKKKYYKSINYISNGVHNDIILESRGDLNEMNFFKKISEQIPNTEPQSDGPIDL